MPLYLLLVAAILLASVLLNKVSAKIGIPILLFFILLGMLFGSDGLFKIPFDDFKIAENVCSVALIFIMFYGGFGTKWSHAKPVAAQATLLASLGVIITAGLTGLFCFLVLRMDILPSFLIGAVLSSTDAASVFSILKYRKLDLKNNTSSLLELESGSNDPCAYMLMVIVLSIMGRGTAGSIGWKLAYEIFAQIVYGIGFGALIAFLSALVLRNINISGAGFQSVFVVGVAILAYAAPASVGGNGYLSVYIVGIVLGNQTIKNKKSLVNFFDGLTNLSQTLIFFLLGLLSFPSAIPSVMLEAFLIAICLTFIARPLAVALIMTPFKAPFRQQLVISWAGLRGAASIVFAVMATSFIKNNNIPGLDLDIFHMVFFIVLFSILLQGTLLPLLSKSLKMVNTEGDVLKTFSDYVEETPINFIEFTVKKDDRYDRKRIKEIPWPSDTLVVIIKRGQNKIFPKGNTLLQEGDRIVLAALISYSYDSMSIVEKTVNKEDSGKSISELSKDPNKLIILIKRNSETIVPSGKTRVKYNDILLIQNNDY